MQAKEAEVSGLEASLAKEQEVNAGLQGDIAAAEEVNKELSELHVEHVAKYDAAEAERKAQMDELLAAQSTVRHCDNILVGIESSLYCGGGM